MAWDHSVVLDMLLAPGGGGGGSEVRTAGSRGRRGTRRGGGGGGGTDIREYMLRYLRLAAGEPRAFLAACVTGTGDRGDDDIDGGSGDDDDGDGVDASDDTGDANSSGGGGGAGAVIGCLQQLDEAMTRLAVSGLMPYNPMPLIRRVRACVDAVQRVRANAANDR